MQNCQGHKVTTIEAMDAKLVNSLVAPSRDLQMLCGRMEERITQTDKLIQDLITLFVFFNLQRRLKLSRCAFNRQIDQGIQFGSFHQWPIPQSPAPLTSL
jgi:hypothetical protein